MTAPEAGLATLMAEALAVAARHVATGGLPFVGVLAAGGQATGRLSAGGLSAGGQRISGFRVNEVARTGDPHAHAEIVAMREVLASAPEALAGSVLLGTGEPCGLCWRFALDHGITDIRWALDRETVADWGFDYRASYRAFGITDAIRTAHGALLSLPDAEAPFRRFAESHLGRGLPTDRDDPRDPGLPRSGAPRPGRDPGSSVRSPDSGVRSRPSHTSDPATRSIDRKDPS